MPTRVGGARMLADGANPQPDRRLEERDVRRDQQHERQPDHQVQIAEHLPEGVDVHVGNPRQVTGCAVLAVDLDEEVAGDTERKEVDREAADDLIGA